MAAADVQLVAAAAAAAAAEHVLAPERAPDRAAALKAAALRAAPLPSPASTEMAPSLAAMSSSTNQRATSAATEAGVAAPAAAVAAPAAEAARAAAAAVAASGQPQTPKIQRRGLGSFVSGAVSGVLMGALLQPFDVVRTHLQAQRMAATSSAATPAATSAAAVSAARAVTPPAASAAVQSALRAPLAAAATSASAASALQPATMQGVVARIVAREGIRGLWRGTGPTCVRVGLGAGIYFATLDIVLEALRTAASKKIVRDEREEQAKSKEKDDEGRRGEGRKKQGMSSPLAFSAGVVARSLAAAALCPVSVVKTRMEAEGLAQVGAVTAMAGAAAAQRQGHAAAAGYAYQYKYRGTWDGVVSIARREGVAGLFKGLGPTLLRDAPYSGLYLVFYARLRELFLNDAQTNLTRQTEVKPRQQSAAARAASTAAAAAMAGALATLLTHPPDVVRTYLQLDSSKLTAGANHSLVSAAQHIWQTQGASGFLHGAAPRVLKRSLQQALGWAVYEAMLKTLTGRTIWDERQPSPPPPSSSEPRSSSTPPTTSASLPAFAGSRSISASPTTSPAVPASSQTLKSSTLPSPSASTAALPSTSAGSTSSLT